MSLSDFVNRYEVELLIAPSILWFFLFLLVPIFIILYYSFLTYESFSVVQEFTVTAWGKALNPSTLSILGKSVAVGVVAVVATLLFGFPVAYYLRFNVGEIAGLVIILALVIPFWTSEIVRTMGWFPILGTTGAINQFLAWLGVVDQPVRWLLFSPFAQFLGYLQNYVVFMFAPIYIVLFDVDEDLISASETLRANKVRTFWRVTLPLSLPGVVIGSIFVFVLAVGNFIIPQFLSGGASAITLVIFQEVQTGLNYPAASALSILLLIVELIMVVLLVRIADISQIAEG
jgi:ABC-type spermidine/putrescine transport system permease subunit I